MIERFRDLHWLDKGVVIAYALILPFLGLTALGWTTAALVVSIPIYTWLVMVWLDFTINDAPYMVGWM